MRSALLLSLLSRIVSHTSAPYNQRLLNQLFVKEDEFYERTRRLERTRYRSPSHAK